MLIHLNVLFILLAIRSFLPYGNELTLFLCKKRKNLHINIGVYYYTALTRNMSAESRRIKDDCAIPALNLTRQINTVGIPSYKCCLAIKYESRLVQFSFG